MFLIFTLDFTLTCVCFKFVIVAWVKIEFQLKTQSNGVCKSRPREGR